MCHYVRKNEFTARGRTIPAAGFFYVLIIYKRDFVANSNSPAVGDAAK